MNFLNYDIELSPLALKSLAKIPKKDLTRIKNKIEDLSTHARPSDLKKIRGENNLFRIRSGNYRILYRIFDRKLVILIVDVDQRKDIYKKL